MHAGVSRATDPYEEGAAREASGQVFVIRCKMLYLPQYVESSSKEYADDACGGI